MQVVQVVQVLHDLQDLQDYIYLARIDILGKFVQIINKLWQDFQE